MVPLEVLHFASRFQPLFTRIFDEYADEHSADLRHDASGASSSDGAGAPGEKHRGGDEVRP